MAASADRMMGVSMPKDDDEPLKPSGTPWNAQMTS
jgi:hypothetical protein